MRLWKLKDTTTTASKQKVDNKCGKCGKNVTDKARPGLQCEYCGGWFHTECIGMSNEQYSFIGAFGEQFHWFCEKCNPKAVEVLVLINKEQQDVMKSQIVSLTEKVEQITEVKEDNALWSHEKLIYAKFCSLLWRF